MNLIVILILLVGITISHCGTALTLNGDKYEGNLSFSEQFVSISGKEFTNEVQLSKVQKIILGEVIKTYVLIPEEREGVSVIIRHSVPLEQSTNDAINGIVGIGKPFGKDKTINLPYLSDGIKPDFTADSNALFVGDVVWDLGDAVPPVERELKEVSIWIKSDNKEYCDYSGALEISEGGNMFFPLDGTYTNVNFFEIFGRGFSDTYNNVIYDFAPGSVTGFRYIKLKVFPSVASHNEPYLVEVDVFVNRIKPQVPRIIAIYLLNGTTLVGNLKSINSKEIILSVEKKEFTVPLVSVGKVLFRNVPEEFKDVVNSGRSGVLLRNGDFIDGEVKEVDEDIVSLYSTLLGVRRLSIRLNVVAMVLGKPKLAKPDVKIITRYGSEIKGSSIKFEQENIKLKEEILGEVEFPYRDLAEIEFVNRNQ